MSGPARIRVVDVRSSAKVSAAQAFEEWETGLSSTYVPVSVTPVQLEEFHGSVDHIAFDDLELTTIRTSAQRIRRTPRLISRSDESYLYAGIGLGGGRGWLEQGEQPGEHVMGPTPGELYLLDTTRPYTAHFDDSWARVVVQVRMSRIRELTGLRPEQIRTGIAIRAGGAMGIIARYFRDLAALEHTDTAAASMLAEHGIGLVASAVLISSGQLPGGPPAQVLLRQQVLSFVRRRHSDPALTVEQIALGCAISRSTLYRLFGETDGGIVAILRRIRVDHARNLLRTTGQSLTSVATASGFGSERHFYRAFKHDTGSSPGEYRAQWMTQQVSEWERTDSAS